MSDKGARIDSKVAIIDCDFNDIGPAVSFVLVHVGGQLKFIRYYLTV